MGTFASATIMGRLTRDPETRYLPSGSQLAEFTLAVDNWKKDKPASFLDCVAFGKTADVVAQYFHKGNPVVVECGIEQQKWQAKDGSNRSKIVFKVDRVHFVDSGKRDEDRGEYNQTPPVAAEDENQDAGPPPTGALVDTDDDGDPALPF